MPLHIPVGSEPRMVLSLAHQELMHTCFQQVCDPKDWKAPVNCMVPWDCACVYVQAIEYMTGVKPDSVMAMTRWGRMAHITSTGYRAGPAGP